MAVKSNLELKVGIFAFIALVILTVVVFSIGEIYIFRPGYRVKVCFSFASGVSVGAPVRVAGTDAGEIEEIELTYDRILGRSQVILSIWLNSDVQIPRDSYAYVNIAGLIGEAYLEIIPGEDFENILQEGDMLAGRDPLSTDTMMEIVHKVGSNLDAALDSVNDVLDEETKDALKETIYNFRDLSENIKIITGRLERGEGKLGAWLKPKKKKR